MDTKKIKWTHSKIKDTSKWTHSKKIKWTHSKKIKWTHSKRLNGHKD